MLGYAVLCCIEQHDRACLVAQIQPVRVISRRRANNVKDVRTPESRVIDEQLSAGFNVDSRETEEGKRVFFLTGCLHMQSSGKLKGPAVSLEGA